MAGQIERVQGGMPTKPCNAACHAIHFNLVIGGIGANIKDRACRGWHHQCVVARKQVLNGAIQPPACALRPAKISTGVLPVVKLFETAWRAD
jgi:hypothetical protein